MHPTTRKLYPLLALIALVGATLWATSFGTLPPADFTFNNGTEVKSIDPAQVTGAPEGRMIHAVFEGLYRPDPKTLQPQPGIATTANAADIISNHGKTYTFPLRRGAFWSDGTPVTAEDFRWSWQRLLHRDRVTIPLRSLCLHRQCRKISFWNG